MMPFETSCDDARPSAVSGSGFEMCIRDSLKEEVSSEEIAEVVSTWTGIPVSKMMQGEMAKLVDLEDKLHERVVGQDEACLLYTSRCV